MQTNPGAATQRRGCIVVYGNQHYLTNPMMTDIEVFP